MDVVLFWFPTETVTSVWRRHMIKTNNRFLRSKRSLTFTPPGNIPQNVCVRRVSRSSMWAQLESSRLSYPPLHDQGRSGIDNTNLTAPLKLKIWQHLFQSQQRNVHFCGAFPQSRQLVFTFWEININSVQQDWQGCCGSVWVVPVTSLFTDWISAETAMLLEHKFFFFQDVLQETRKR